jgi:hypothetical protein
VLNLIFNRLKFHGHLRLSCVCQRFLRLIENDVAFMRTVQFRVGVVQFRQLAQNPGSKVIRTYTNVAMIRCNIFGVWPNLEWQLLGNVESLTLDHCSFRDRNVFVSFLEHCKLLKTVETEYVRFQSYLYEPIDMIQNPVSIVFTYLPNWKLLECFTSIKQIHVKHWECWKIQDKIRILSQHPAAISSLDISRCDMEFFQLCVNLPELKLEHLYTEYNEKIVHMEQLVQLFAKQKSSLTSMKFFVDQLLLDAICSHLVNLKILVLVTSTKIRLNDLKVLPRLNSLTVEELVYRDDSDINIEELLNLDHLDLVINSPRKITVKQPLLKLKKLKLTVPFDNQLFAKIATMLPNLIELHLNVSFAINKKD